MHPKLKLLSVEWIFLGCVFCALILSGVPRISDPSFWDETKVYFRPLFQLYEGIGFWHAQEATKFDRPPGIHFLYLPFLQIFGPSLYLVRVLNIIYFGCGIFLFWLTLRKESRLLAGLTIAYVLLTPIHQVYFVQYVGEPQLFALYGLFLFFIAHYPEKFLFHFILGIFLGLTRETSLALIPATWIYFSLNQKTFSGRKILSCFGPLLGILIWWSYLYLKTGSVFTHVTFERGDINLLGDFLERPLRLWKNFLSPYLLLPLIISSFVAFLFKRRIFKLSPLTGFCLTLTLSYVLIFSAHRIAIPRYYLAVSPFAVYFFLSFFRLWILSPKSRALILAVVLVPVILMGDPLQIKAYQDSKDYQKVLKLHQRVISAVKESCPKGGQIMTSWPFIEILKSSYVGYGKAIPYEITYEAKNPEVILWTDYPEQISRETVEEVLRGSEYKETIFSFKDYQIYLYKRTDGCSE